jgi:hypothetical protein
MRSFLCKGKKPILKWKLLPENTFFEFEGKLPNSYSLAISPSKGFIVIDVDVDIEKGKDGFKSIPRELRNELETTFNYPTKRNGKHYWFKYTGDKELANKTSGLDIDLRTNKGYVIFYPEGDIRNHLHEIKETSSELNEFLESLFSYI